MGVLDKLKIVALAPKTKRSVEQDRRAKLVEQLAEQLKLVEATQDRCPRRPSRPRHHLPVGRGRCHRQDGARHPCRDPALASTGDMRGTAILIQASRKRQDRSVRRAKKKGRRARMPWVCGLIRLTPGVSATAETARGEKHLLSAQDQAILPSSGRPLGECRLKKAVGNAHDDHQR